MFLKPILFKVR